MLLLFQNPFSVPSCPICSKPVPIKRGEDPNHRVSVASLDLLQLRFLSTRIDLTFLQMNQHIESGCKVNNTSTSAPSNTCRQQGCKTKLLVPMICSSCKQSFCVKHRLEIDHQCAGRRAASASPSRVANTKRNLTKFLKDVPPRPSSTPVANAKSVSSTSQTGLGIRPIDR